MSFSGSETWETKNGGGDDDHEDDVVRMVGWKVTYDKVPGEFFGTVPSYTKKKKTQIFNYDLKSGKVDGMSQYPS